MRYCTANVLISVILCISLSSCQRDDLQSFGVGELKFSVPKKNLLVQHQGELTSAFMDAFDSGTMQNTDGLGLYFGGEEIEQSVSSYSLKSQGSGGMFDTSLTPVVERADDNFPHPFESTLIVLRETAAKGTGSGSDTEVAGMAFEQDFRIDGAYRLFHEGTAMNWLLLDGDPREQATLSPSHSAVIAYCSKIEFPDDVHNIHCLRSTQFKGLDITYGLYAENYHLYKQIDRFLTGKLAEWTIATH